MKTLENFRILDALIDPVENWMHLRSRREFSGGTNRERGRGPQFGWSQWSPSNGEKRASISQILLGKSPALSRDRFLPSVLTISLCKTLRWGDICMENGSKSYHHSSLKDGSVHALRISVLVNWKCLVNYVVRVMNSSKCHSWSNPTDLLQKMSGIPFAFATFLSETMMHFSAIFFQ